MVFVLAIMKQTAKGLCTKDVHPKGGRGGFKIVDENGNGGRGVLGEWMSTFQDLPKYNCVPNLTNLKSKWSCYYSWAGIAVAV